jgi:N-acetyl-anhydromuramyl-L-alanine amidase AmpD
MPMTSDLEGNSDSYLPETGSRQILIRLGKPSSNRKRNPTILCLKGTIRFTRKQAHASRRSRRLPIRNIVLHSSDGRKEGDLATLTGNKVSAHWYVTRAAEVFHLVNDENTAFHAGEVLNPDVFSNDATIGIEQEHFDPEGKKKNEDWPDLQIEKVAQLVAFLLQEHRLESPHDIKTHAEIAKRVGRKQDPFEKFHGFINNSKEFRRETVEI